MSLTQHLYRFDEVKAAFLYSLKQGRQTEALFWLNQLENSYHGGEARRLLFVSWMMRIGIKRLAWLDGWVQLSTTREGRQTLCIQLIRCKEYDSSIWLLVLSLVATDTPLPEAPGYLFTTWIQTCANEDEVFWQPIVDASNDERLDRILLALQEDMKQYALFAKATATLLIHAQRNLSNDTWTPFASFTNPEPTNLPSTILEGRQYAIPYDSLFGMTWRGVGCTTLDELRTLGPTQFQQSPYWKKQFPANPDDTTLEQFWNTHFPWTTCNHPDEWSSEEQGKSHGHGVPSGPLQRWWSNWIIPEHMFVWGVVHTRIVDWVKLQRIDTKPIFELLLEMYKSFSYTEYLLVYPMKKMFVCI